jgi:hypothetical protein
MHTHRVTKFSHFHISHRSAFGKRILSRKSCSVFHPGFIAQEVETVLPELITEAQNVYLKDNAKGLSMTNFIPYIVKAFQEQNEVVQSQQSQIQELHTKLAAMEARLAAAGF